MFCAPGDIFGSTEGVGSCFHILRSRTRFRWYRGRRVPFSCFARPESFSAVPRASGPVFMFCDPELVFGDAEGLRSCFHVLCSRKRFQRRRGRRVPYSYFALPDAFWPVSRASGPVFMFCAPGLSFAGTEGDEYRFLIFRTRTHFRQHRRRRVPFSCFARPHSLSAEPRASTPVFMFCAPELVLGGTEGVGSRFNIFALPNSFSVVPRASSPVFMVGAPGLVSTVPWASGPIFMFCAPGLIFGVTEGVGPRFLVLHGRTLFQRYRGLQNPFSCFARSDSFSAVPRASGPVFMFCSPVLVFGGTEGVGSRLHVLRARTRFRRNQGRRVSFSCFALPYSFSVVPRATGTVFLFCVPELVFDGTGGVGSRFHVLRSRIHFRRYQGRQSHFHVLPARTRFLRYRGRQVPFSCFALLDSFSAVPRSSGPVFMFCAPAPIIGRTEGVGSRFHVLRSRTHLGGTEGVGCRFHGWHSWNRFDGTEGVGSCFHVSRARTRFWRY
jgi:hypothetical protein